MTGPGDLNRRLVVEAPAEIKDGAGGVTRGYAVAAIVWARLVPQSARADASAGNVGGAVRYRIVMRPRSDITTRHRLRDGERIFRILFARLSANRRFLEIEVEERAD